MGVLCLADCWVVCLILWFERLRLRICLLDCFYALCVVGLVFDAWCFSRIVVIVFVFFCCIRTLLFDLLDYC